MLPDLAPGVLGAVGPATQLVQQEQRARPGRLERGPVRVLLGLALGEDLLLVADSRRQLVDLLLAPEEGEFSPRPGAAGGSAPSSSTRRASISPGFTPRRSSVFGFSEAFASGMRRAVASSSCAGLNRTSMAATRSTVRRA